MPNIKYATECNQTQTKRVDLGNSILKCDVIYDALKVICDKNLKRPRNLTILGSLYDITTVNTIYDLILKLHF